MHLFSSIHHIARGQSYWKVFLTSGKEVSEVGTKVEFVHDQETGKPVARKRQIQWYDDIVASGDARRIKELCLVTPDGEVRLPIIEPYSAFQLHRGTMLPFTGERLCNMQLIGRVDNKETGDCTACIWDAIEQKLYTDVLTTVFDFCAWREGVAKVGTINLDVVGVRL